MTTAIVLASMHHDNTRKVALEMVECLSAKLLNVDDKAAADLSEFDLVGIGSGIYFGRHHVALLRLVQSWQRPPHTVFLFSTAGLPCLRYLQHAALRNRLRKKGCRIAGEFCCRGWDTVGPLWLVGGINRNHPDQSDLARARRFAASIAP